MKDDVLPEEAAARPALQVDVKNRGTNRTEDAVAGGPSFEFLQTTSENLAARDAVRNLRVTVPVVVEE